MFTARISGANHSRGANLAACICAVATLVATVCVGCSSWSNGNLEQKLLKTPRMSPDTVVLEMALLDIAHSDALWREVDEQHLPVDLRRRLAAQGLRAGVLGTQMPGWIKQRLAQQQKMLRIDEDSGAALVGEDQKVCHLQCRCGSPRAIDLGKQHPELAIGEVGDEPSCTLRDAQCKLSLLTQPQGDGRVRVEVTPEIHHGPARQRWVGEGGSFRVDLSHDCRRFDDLTLAAVLAPGQTLILAGIPETAGLGQWYFAGEDGMPGQRLLLLRLAHTQFDDLFAPAATLTPIATDVP